MMIIFLLFILCVMLLVATGIFYRITFYYPASKRIQPSQIKSSYAPVIASRMKKVMGEMETVPYEEVSICSKDGCVLSGRYYQIDPGQPLEIFFHGYHGNFQWDGYGCFKYCQSHRHNLLLVEERAHGKSKNNTITFGIKERYDCLAWADYAAKRLGEPVDIILSGVSMGAATVLMASELPLPSNVKAIIADCGYTSPVEIMKYTAVCKHIPAGIGIPFAKLAAKLFGGFDLEESSAINAVSHTDIPILFIHGDQDKVVPFSMCKELYEACASRKKQVIIPKSSHAVNAITDYELYEREVETFLEASFS